MSEKKTVKLSTREKVEVTAAKLGKFKKGEVIEVGTLIAKRWIKEGKAKKTA